MGKQGRKGRWDIGIVRMVRLTIDADTIDTYWILSILSDEYRLFLFSDSSTSNAVITTTISYSAADNEEEAVEENEGRLLVFSGLWAGFF